MPPTLHVAPGTIALASHAALEEAGIEFDLAWLDFKAGDQSAAAYLAINPKGRVPALVTEEGTLTESIAILEWIAATRPQAALMPDDPWQAARARETMAFLASTTHVAHAHKMRGHRWSDDPAAHASMKEKVPSNMADSAAWLEARMDGDWVAGRFSVADLYLWAVMRWLDGDGVPLAGFPKLQDHSRRVAARPATGRALAQHA